MKKYFFDEKEKENENENEKIKRPFIHVSDLELKTRLEKIRNFLSDDKNREDEIDFYKQKIVDIENELRSRAT